MNRGAVSGGLTISERPMSGMRGMQPVKRCASRTGSVRWAGRPGFSRCFLHRLRHPGHRAAAWIGERDSAAAAAQRGSPDASRSRPGVEPDSGLRTVYDAASDAVTRRRNDIVHSTEKTPRQSGCTLCPRSTAAPCLRPASAPYGAAFSDGDPGIITLIMHLEVLNKIRIGGNK